MPITTPRVVGLVFTAVIATAVVALGAGCAASSPHNPDPGVSTPAEEAVLANERVEIHTLIESELRTYTADIDGWPEESKEQFNRRVVEEIGVESLGAGVVVGAVVDFVFDFVASAIAAEAASYQRQWGGRLYGDGFWAGSPERTNEGLKVKPNIVGFEVLRFAGDFNTASNPAARFVFVFKQNIADPRLFKIRPLAVEVNATKARFAADTLNLKVDLAIDATWIDKSQTARTERIAQPSFELSGYPLTTTPVWIDELSDRTAGWFAGIPFSVSPDGTLIGNGVFAITVNVTETDPSSSREIIEQVGRLIELGRGPVEEAAGAIR